ncbi:MAG: phosphate ABC transporter permease PstA, partial [bacterium]|nr:phosphate ABC transporter permease PstA [bacterium]
MKTGAATHASQFPWTDRAFQLLALLIISMAMLVLFTLIANIFLDGINRLNFSFLTSFPSRFANKAGIYSAWVGSAYLMILTGIFSVPLGVGAAIYLEEYAPKNRFTRIIELNIANLAGVPSVIYGLLGLQLFVRYAHLERSLISGALTMSLLILPIIIIASREAVKAIPKSIREAALALGATKSQVVFSQVLPVALPGIMTGCILAFSRAIGEAAPLITLGALTYIPFLPDGLLSPFTVLPIQAFNWISRPQEAFHENAAAAIMVLM